MEVFALKPADKSHIGNFYGLLKNYSEGANRAYSFLTDNWADFEQWKAMGRAKIFELLNYFPKEEPLNPIVTGTKERDKYREEDIEFSSAFNVRVKGTMLIPKKRRWPFPCCCGNS